MGAAYVFARNHGGPDNWGEVEKLTASDAAGGDGFGQSVAISGDRIVVGALRGDGAVIDSGTLYVFERNQGGADLWGEVIELAADDGAVGDEFGRSVAAHNDTIVAGAPRDSGAGTDSGSAYVFERNEGGLEN